MKMYIGGKWIEGHSESRIKKFAPATGRLIYEFSAASKDDVDSAIRAAYEAFDSWGALTSVERSRYIFKAKELIERNRRELEQIIMKENGKIKKEVIEEVDGVIDQLQYYAEYARKLTGDIVEGTTHTRRIFQYLLPYGVVVAITPWNFPAAMVARKLAPALLTGNTVVLKPSSDTPGSAEWIIKKFEEAGVPKGVLNFVVGKGSEIGDYIVAHKEVSLVTMTGSTSTGQRIMQQASSNMAKLILELGGKAPFMVWKDADIENALKALLWAKYWNAGQSCIAAERLYVHEDIFNIFIKKFAALSNRIRLGNPTNADMAPLINSDALKNVKALAQEAELRGGKEVVESKLDMGGQFANGYFMKPSIIIGADQKSALFQDEVFGPLIGAMPVSDKEELFKLANDSKYGLASYLFTKDLSLVQEASERIRFGELYINMSGPEASQGYHTGFRMTGQAGEGSKYGIAEYLKRKNVYTDYSGRVALPTFRKDLK
ncbi:MAG: D-glyceraldehyde dehydrogenase [Candidatus Micrarchaeia archaeon]